MHTIPELLLTLQNNLGVHFPRLAVVVGASVDDALHSSRLVACPPRQGDFCSQGVGEDSCKYLTGAGERKWAGLVWDGDRRGDENEVVFGDGGPSQKAAGDLRAIYRC